MTLEIVIFCVVFAVLIAAWVVVARRSPSPGQSSPHGGRYNPGLIGRPGDDNPEPR